MKWPRDGMFSLKYNLLALFQALIGLLNYLLLIRLFGTSQSADAYLLSLAICSALQLLEMLSIEQFMIFYNDTKAKSLLEAHRLYHTALFVALLTGISFFLLSRLGVSFIMRAFTEELDPQRYSATQLLLRIATIELLVAPILALNQKLLNAEMSFSLPYVLNLIPGAFVLLAGSYLWILGLNEIQFLAYGRVVGAILATAASFLGIYKLGISISVRIRHKELLPLLRNSFSTRLGHNIHNFLFTPVTTNILTLLPTGFASYFFYANRLVGVINSIALGPSSSLFQSKLSHAWSRGDRRRSRLTIGEYQRTTLPLFFVAMFGGYVGLPLALSIVGHDLAPTSINHIKLLFLGLMLWQFVILAESGYVFLLITNRDSRLFIMTNALFISLYFVTVRGAFASLGIYAIPVAAVLAQSANFAVYAYFGRKRLIGPRQRRGVGETS